MTRVTRPIPSELTARYHAEGWWTADTMGDLLARGLAANPGGEFRVHSAVRPWAGTVGEVADIARRLAQGLENRGVGPGDVIAFQLPNWMEAAAVFWAAAFLGAVVVPIVHFYGRKEVGYILTATNPKVFVTAERFGRLEYQPDLCEHVPIVGLVGRDFDNLLDNSKMRGQRSADPADPALIAFTSGTTRDPKGVIHSHQTLGFETRQLSSRHPPDVGTALTAVPVGHFMGMLSAFLTSVIKGTPIHLMDVWDPAQVLALMRSDGLCIGGGAAYHLTSLLDHPDFTPAHLATMKYAGMGGAPVPPAVTERLTAHGITVYRSYGSTEHPSVTGAHYLDSERKRLYTDGQPLAGVEIRLTDDGEILSRGPDLCLGYTDEALTAATFDADGWYRTGDTGVLDDDGYLTITGRKSDVIIRGGENISAVEVEDLLLGLDGVAEAAVVAAPDARLGEHAAAILRMRAGVCAPTLAQVRAHLEQAGLARQKWPEEIHTVADFPRTASGKVQKYVLRATIAAG